jgi:hypothetical protein
MEVNLENVVTAVVVSTRRSGKRYEKGAPARSIWAQCWKKSVLKEARGDEDSCLQSSTVDCFG